MGYVIQVVDGKNWSKAVRDPEVKRSTEGLGFIMWLAVAWWIVVVPTLEEVRVHGSKTACAFFGLNPKLDGVAVVRLEVVEAYMSIMTIEITSTSSAEGQRWIAAFGIE